MNPASSRTYPITEEGLAVHTESIFASWSIYFRNSIDLRVTRVTGLSILISLGYFVVSTF